MGFLFRIVCGVMVMLLGAQALAAPPRLATNNLGDFSRISFAWDAPTPMRFSVSGNTVTLEFDRAVGSDVASIASRLKPVIRGVTRTPDGKRIILSMAENYRVRQFLSGQTNGIDIITVKPEANVMDDAMRIAPPSPKASIYSTKKTQIPPLAKQPSAVQTAKPPQAPKPEAKPAPKAATIYTTKAPPKTPEKTPEPQAPANVTTKAGAKAEKKESPTTSETKPALKTEKPNSTQVSAPQPPAATPPVTATAEEKEVAPPTVPASPEPALPAPQLTETLLIGAVGKATDPTLEFLWSERTAMASFVRGNDLWVIFSHPAKVNAARVLSILPKPLSTMEAYGLKGATVLRFSLSEALYPIASHVKGSYAWRLSLQKAPPKRAEIPYTIRAGEKTSIVFDALDGASPLSFYDPARGDRLLVMPLYDSSHHVSLPRSMAGADILLSGQGIAVRSDDDSATLSKTMEGVVLSMQAGVPALDKMPIVPGQKDIAYMGFASDGLVISYPRFFKSAQSFAESRARIARELASTNARTRPLKLHELAGTYMAEGFGVEAVKILNDMKNTYPDYYTKERLSIMHTGAYFMADRMAEAREVFASTPLDMSKEEAAMWRDVMALFAPISIVPTITADDESTTDLPSTPARPAATVDLLKYHDGVLRLYPPRLRQKLSIIGADQYIQQKKYPEAVALFDRLSEDNILKPIQPFAEYMIGRIAAEKGENKRALEIWQKLAQRSENPYVAARAEFASISLQFTSGDVPIEKAIERLEGLRLDWRYDALEQEILKFLGQLYADNKQYDHALRVWKELLNYYPGTPDALELTVVMTDLFMKLYTGGLADELEPLKSLALFYEFRDLIPVDARGDEIVRKLADRLANVDLLDRAIALLVHQVKSRSEGAERALLGTQLSLFYVLNNQPEEALNALEASSYGGFGEDIARLRGQLTAQAFEKLKDYRAALQALSGDKSEAGNRLRMEILWAMEDWPSVINAAEDVLSAREDFTAPLSKPEQEFLLRAALAYSFEKDTTQLKYLRDYYSKLIPPESPNKAVFDYLTNFTAPLSPKDISVVAAQLDGTESFLSTLKTSLAEGNVSNLLSAQQKAKAEQSPQKDE